MRTNNFSETAFKFLSACNKFHIDDTDKFLSLDTVFKTLPHVHKKLKLIYEVYIPKGTGYDGTCVPYARTLFAKHLKVGYEQAEGPFGALFGIQREVSFGKGNYPLIDSVDADFTPEGVWEYILLLDIEDHLPKIWHSNYGNFKYILDEDKYPEIAHIKEYLTPEGTLPENYEKIAEERWFESYKSNGGKHEYPTVEDLIKALSLTNENKLPFASVNEDGTISVRYYIWNEWSGLRHLHYVAMGSDRGGFIIMKIADEPVFNYKCGIVF